ncbi:unnamed protein product [Linum trigynum]|uniref:Uncharacterized protein n=1 Tax=Linum trigynum TaxID=586398 RepID=A0AAV2E7I4_9ROSI
MTQLEVGSSGRNSTARHAVSDAPPAAHENPEDRVPQIQVHSAANPSSPGSEAKCTMCESTVPLVLGWITVATLSSVG